MAKEAKRWQQLVGGGAILVSHLTGTHYPRGDDWSSKVSSAQGVAEQSWDHVQSEKQRRDTTDALKDATRARKMPPTSRTVKRPDPSKTIKGMKDIK